MFVNGLVDFSNYKILFEGKNFFYNTGKLSKIWLFKSNSVSFLYRSNRKILILIN